MISYADMMILPEYAKKRTDAKCYRGGVFIKKPKRKPLGVKICQSGTDGIQAVFKRYSREIAGIHFLQYVDVDALYPVMTFLCIMPCLGYSYQ